MCTCILKQIPSPKLFLLETIIELSLGNKKMFHLTCTCVHHIFFISGMKPGQRKVLFTCFKRNDKREIKVAQLAGSVAEHSAYHHGEVSVVIYMYITVHVIIYTYNVHVHVSESLCSITFTH